MNRIARYFVNGLLVITPTAITAYVCWQVFRVVDGWLSLPWYGAGFVITLLVITLAGWLATTYLWDTLFGFFEAAMERYRALQSPPVFWPSLLHFQSILLLMAGRPAEGLTAIDDAIAVIAGLPEPQTLASELLLVKGHLVLAHTGDAGAAQIVYERALQSADQLEAPMLQLRVATALARLWQAHGQADDARAVLGEAYERFSEGFRVVDLVDARQLLDELSAGS